MRPAWKKERSALMREAERLDLEDAGRKLADLDAEREDNAAWDPTRYEEVDGLPRWVRSAMRGPL